tara:strand:- start:73991 stop:74146 length:156 start_codon:yes stop_codon:yes gene_type:complete
MIEVTPILEFANKQIEMWNHTTSALNFTSRSEIAVSLILINWPVKTNFDDT